MDSHRCHVGATEDQMTRFYPTLGHSSGFDRPERRLRFEGVLGLQQPSMLWDTARLVHLDANKNVDMTFSSQWNLTLSYQPCVNQPFLPPLFNLHKNWAVKNQLRQRARCNLGPSLNECYTNECSGSREPQRVALAILKHTDHRVTCMVAIICSKSELHRSVIITLVHVYHTSLYVPEVVEIFCCLQRRPCFLWLILWG